MFLLASGCQEGESAEDNENGSGKADDVDDNGEGDRACALDEDESRSFVQFVNNDTVQFRCRGPGGQFVETGCCAQEIDEFIFSTGCPPQAAWSSGAGAAKVCVEDQPDSSESVDGVLAVSTMCCSLMCDSAASWDDDSRTTCRNSMGQFHPHACCQLNDEQRCGAATFDTEPDDAGFVHCRAREGEFAGQFAPAACCLDECTALVESGEDLLPIECLVPIEDECLGAAADGNGYCRAEDGRFAKASCCAGQDDIDKEGSDACRLAELYGDDLQDAGCL